MDMDKTQLAGMNLDANTTQMISRPEATQMSVSISCPVCQANTPAGEKYCSDCGFLLSSQVTEGVSPSPIATARLIDPASGREFLLNPGENTIGRESTDVLVAHPTVSRKHAKLSLIDGKYILEDLGSTNGTWAGNVKLEPGQPVEIENGAEVRFGSATFKLDVPPQVEAEREVDEAEKLEAAAVDSEIVEQTADEQVPTIGESVAEEQAADEAVVTQMPVAPAVGAGFDASPEQSIEQPIEAEEIHEEITVLAKLVAVEDGTEYSLKQGENTIGRRPTNSIVVADPYTSGSHAVITAENDTFSLTDVGSTNGTMVNGTRIDANVPQELKDGDELTFGQKAFKFVI